MDFEQFRNLIQQVLAEDLGGGDITTDSLVSPPEQARASIIAREKIVAAGLPLAEMVFRQLDPGISCRLLIGEGEEAGKGKIIMEVEGAARAIISAERTALNFLQRLCGIATFTRRFVKRSKNKKVSIMDTRKTTPGLRKLEKYAVRLGGGDNHRFGLYDAVLIKDNHLKIVSRKGPGKIRRAVTICRRSNPGREIEIEVENLDELEEALQAEADIVLLDNFSPEELTAAVKINRGRAVLEASGGIGLSTVAAAASSGVDRISLGSLTHSAPAADISLEIYE